LVKNIDLWKRLDTLTSQHEVTWEWTKGHDGHRENELADSLSQQAIKDFLRSLGIVVPDKQLDLLTW